VKLTEDILGFPVSTQTLETLADRSLRRIAAADQARYFVCANPHSLEIARREPSFSRAIHDADFVVPDGVGIVLASRLLRGDIRQRVTGMDLFRAINARLDAEGGRRVFFLGSTPQNLEIIRLRMAREYPGVDVAGCHSPPFTPSFTDGESRVMIDAINAVRPDVLWVGLTAPKQETWVSAHRGELNARFIGPVGAVFDYFTGAVPRAAPWFLEHGLEWLPRLARQPGRLWRRNLVSNPLFLLRVVRQRLVAGGRGGRDGT
jgi:N-acetylglucosaminyldiphosphoundecaprenol N-acetyl-beta-D-mannosaminyltransferase